MQVLRLVASLAALLTATAAPALATSSASLGEETKSLEQLHQEALKEGGKLVVYHGGDTPTQQDGVINAFRAAYPDVNLTLIVDYSKYHNARIDNQLETNTLVPDVVALQTLQDYPRWKKQGKLLNYKPKGFSNIYQGYVDPEGAWVSHMTFTFPFFYDEAQLNASGLPLPKTVKDLANPVYAGHIASPPPHDDDAVMFVYSQYIEKYGWEWFKKFSKQNILFQRGSNTPGEAVDGKVRAIGIAGSSAQGPTVKTFIGKGNGSPYLAWGQRMSILKKAKHPAAAKLFFNWILTKEVQSTTLAGISSRVDTNTARPWEVPEASVAKFPVFMEDRANMERIKATMVSYLGEVQGKPSPGELGLYPGL